MARFPPCCILATTDAVRLVSISLNFRGEWGGPILATNDDSQPAGGMTLCNLLAPPGPRCYGPPCKGRKSTGRVFVTGGQYFMISYLFYSRTILAVLKRKKPVGGRRDRLHGAPSE